MAMRAFKPEGQQKALSASAPNKQKNARDESRNAMIRMSPQPDAGEVLAGLVERVTYHNAENGFCVLRARARGHRDVVLIKINQMARAATMKNLCAGIGLFTAVWLFSGSVKSNDRTARSSGVLLSFTIILIKMSEYAKFKNFCASNRLLLFRVAIFD